MSRIDPALMRVVVEAGGPFTPEMISDPGSSLHANLQGDFRREAFSRDYRAQEWQAAVVVAHEQRHYLDYHLTNYGSWLARFWVQIKSAVPHLYTAPKLAVPISYMDDPFYIELFGLPAFGLDRPVQMAARLASNLGERITWDRLDVRLIKHGAGGSQQMEALATAFEVGPIEAFGPPRQHVQTLLGVPRDARRWQDDYVWLGDMLDALDIGPKPISFGENGQVMNTRVWPALLTGALMGRFSELKAEHFRDDPHLADRILASRRLGSLLEWLAKKPRDAADTPERMWEAVNEAAVSLWGESILQSAYAELDYLEARFDEQFGSGKGVYELVLDLGAHLNTRRWVLEYLTEDPMRVLDPLRFWSEGRLPAALLPEYYLADRAGLQVGGDDFMPFTSVFYKAEANGRRCFAKLRPSSEPGGRQQAWDEEFSCLARYFVRGARSPSWVGPELTAVKEHLTGHANMVVVPPFNVQGT